MKQKTSRAPRPADRDSMRPEYDFSEGVRGVTAARYAEARHVVAIDRSVLDVFPDSAQSSEEVFRDSRKRPL